MQLRKEPKISRNASCPCGSGKKYKKCCLIKQEEYAAKQLEARRMIENVKETADKGKIEKEEVVQDSTEKARITEGEGDQTSGA